MLRSRIASTIAAALLSFVLLGATANAKQVTTGTDQWGWKYKTTKWKAGKTSFVHTTYYNSAGKRNHSIRWAKRTGSGPKATVRYFVDAPVKTHGTMWTLGNGTRVKHSRITGPGGEKMSPETWYIGKNTVRGKGEFIAGGHKMDTKMWKTGRGSVLGITRTTRPDGTRSVHRFGQKALPTFDVPTFLK